MATMRKIIVEIEAGEKNCHNCHLVDGYGFCLLLRTPIELDEVPNRLPACLASEAKLTRLVEAADGTQGESYATDEYDEGRGRTYYTIPAESTGELRDALKEVKGE
jgi:hypothetical protein